MEIDESGWQDIEGRFDASSHDRDDLDELVARLESRLVAHFGRELIEIHTGKNDPTRHTMREVAGAAVAHLLPALERGAVERIEPIAPPWDDRWKRDERTASWRS
ncbi:MAG: hypothetical protein AAF567_21795 [Actinomycetota bacterium]